MAVEDHPMFSAFDDKLKALHNAYFERDAAKSELNPNQAQLDALNERVERALSEFMAVCDQID